MEFRVNMTIEIDRVANNLALQTPVNLQLHYKNGQWQGQSENPPLKTLTYDTLEETLISAAKRATSLLQAESLDQPHIIGKITPSALPDAIPRSNND